MTATWLTFGLMYLLVRFEVTEIDHLTVEGTLLQFHIDKDNPESFIVSRVVHKDQISLVLSVLTPCGIWDGFLYLKNAAVTGVDIDEDYLNKLLRLSRIKGQCEPKKLYSQLNSLDSILRYSQTRHKVVGVEFYESGGTDLNGIVIGYDDFIVKIHQIDEYGQDDGLSFVKRESITRMAILSERLIDIELLFNN